jgi:hypothetical protein
MSYKISPEKVFFYIYDVIVNPKKRKRSVYHYSHTHTIRNTVGHSWEHNQLLSIVTD